MSSDEPTAPPHSKAPYDSTLSIPRGLVDEILGTADETAMSLVVLEGREVGRRIKVTEQPLTAGRDAHAGIVLVDRGVSRLHALVVLVDGAVVVEDLGSTNGTYVDGRQITSRTSAQPLVKETLETVWLTEIIPVVDDESAAIDRVSS